MIVTKGLLEEIGRSLREDLPEGSFWLDVAEGRVIVLTIDPDEDRELERQGTAEDQLPDWQRQELALAHAIRADLEGNRYRRIPTGGGGGRLGKFARSLEDERLADRVRDAMHGGRGGYRRVREVLARAGREHLWHEFQDAQDRADALQWLEGEGLVDTERDPG